MSGISTQISMVDNITPILNSIYSSLNMVNASFGSIYDTASQDMDMSGFTMMENHMLAAQTAANQLLEQMGAVAKVEWATPERIEVFQNTGIDRFTLEMQSLNDITNQFLQSQHQIDQQALNMQILPDNAISDITATNQRIADLGQQISALQNIDISTLDASSVEKLNSEFENMRGSMVGLVNLQDSMNDALQVGDFSRLNAGYNQLNDAAESFEKRIRETTTAIQEMTRIEWVTPERIEIFQNTGVDRFTLEMQSLSDITNQFLQSQQQIGQQALNMQILPDNAISDITATNQRIADLGQQMSALQNIDISTLDASSVEKLNSEFENMRGSMVGLVNLQDSMNDALQAGDFSRLNAGYSQLNDSAESFEKRIRETTIAMQEMSSIEWISPQNIEIFNGNDVERFKLEVQSSNEMLNQIIATQNQIAVQAENMNLLPPNVLADINIMGTRIEALRREIEETHKTRIAVVGIEQANSEVEQLRQQLNSTVQVQEQMNTALRNMDVATANRAYTQLNSIISSTEQHLRNNTIAQETFNDSVSQAEVLTRNLKGIVAGFVGVFSVRAATSFIQGSIDMVHDNIRAEQQLANVLANRGAMYEDFVALQNQAAEIQSRTAVGGTAMILGAAELATYVHDMETLHTLMDTLTDFSVGMSGGLMVGTDDIVKYAQMLGAAMEGNYRMLDRRGGFILTEAQREIIANGSEMERALVLSDVVNQSWAGLAEQMAQTPEGMRLAFQNSFGDIRAGFAERLIPATMDFYSTLQNSLPRLEQVLYGVVPAIQTVVSAMSTGLNVAFNIYDFIVNNWDTISSVVMATAGTFAVWKTYTVLQSIATSTLTKVAAQQSSMAMRQTVATNKLSVSTLNQSTLTNKLTLSALKQTAVSVKQRIATVKQSVAINKLTASMFNQTFVISKLTIASNKLLAVQAKSIKLLGTMIGSTMKFSAVLLKPLLPITLIAGSIYGLVLAVRHFSDETDSAMGIVTGIFFSAGAFIYNHTVVPLWNGFAMLANFLGNVFRDPLSSSKILFLDFSRFALQQVQNLVSGIETLLNPLIGVLGLEINWSNGFNNQISSLENNADRIRQESGWREIIGSLEHWDYAEAFSSGYERGSSVGNMFDPSNFTVDVDMYSHLSSLFDGIGYHGMSNTLDGIAYDVGSIASDTASVANISEENLRYWRDIAERDAINRFTTATVSVNFRGGVHNTVNSNVDLDGIVDYIADGVQEAIEITAERTAYE